MTTAQQRPRGRFRPVWEDASLFPERVGVAWWGAVLIAVGLASVGAFADLQRLNRLGLIFQGCYFLGCVIAVVVVQRKALFGPMVQPPLILAFTVPAVVLLAGGAPSGGSFSARALSVATPLINGFPTMALTAVLTIAVGAFRLVTQRPPAAARKGRAQPGKAQPGREQPGSARRQPPRRPATGETNPTPGPGRG